MTNVSDKISEKINTHILRSVTFFFGKHAAYGIFEK